MAKKIALVYEKKYGKPISIQILGKDNGEVYRPVQYNIDKLKKTGFKLTENMEKEIERTLSLCKNFAKNLNILTNPNKKVFHESSYSVWRYGNSTA